MPRLKLKKPSGEALKSLVRQQLSHILRQVEAARKGEKVHGARRGLKVARSTLRLARTGIGEQAFRDADRPLREAAKLLASARHAEALIETIAKFEDAELAASLTAAAAMPAGAPDAPPLATAIHEAQELVRVARKAASRFSLAKHDIAPLVSAMAHCYGAARRGLHKGLAANDVEHLHEARKSVIHHLHHVELLGGLWPAMFKPWAQELTALRMALGDLNDLAELEKAAGGKASEAALAAIAGRRKDLVARVASSAGVLFAEKPKAFAARMEAMWRHAMD